MKKLLTLLFCAVSISSFSEGLYLSSLFVGGRTNEGGSGLFYATNSAMALAAIGAVGTNGVGLPSYVLTNNQSQATLKSANLDNPFLEEDIKINNLMASDIWHIYQDSLTSTLTVSNDSGTGNVLFTRPVVASSFSGNGSGLTNLNTTTDTNVFSFVSNNGITSQFSIDALNNMVSVFKTAGRYSDLVDVVLLGNQFVPTNKATLMGRTWVNPPQCVAPTVSDQNYMYFDSGNQGIQLNGLNLNSNYMVCITYSLPPSMYSKWDGDVLPGGTTAQDQLVFSLLNTNDNSGVFISSIGSFPGCQDKLHVWPHGAGRVTNTMYQGGIISNQSGSSSNSTSPIAVVDFVYRNSIRNCMLTLAGNTSGQFQTYFDDVPGVFAPSVSGLTNLFQSPVGMATNILTSIRINGDGDFTNNFAAGAASYETNGTWRIQSVFIFRTNDVALARLAWTAHFYGDIRRNIYVHYGDSIFADTSSDAAGNFMQSSNSLWHTLETQNPQWNFILQSQGGSSLASFMTNAYSVSYFGSTNFPLWTTLDLPTKGFNNVVGININHNTAASSTLTLVSDVNKFTLQSFLPVITNGFPIWNWKTCLSGTNASGSVAYNQSGMSNLLRFNMSMDTNVWITRTLDMARRVTNRSFTNSSFDSVHLYKNNLVVSELAKEFNLCGTVQLLFPDTYTAGATGWTNFTAQNMTVYMTAGTSVQFSDAKGNPYGPVITTAALVTMPLPPMAYFVGTVITATVTDDSIQ